MCKKIIYVMVCVAILSGCKYSGNSEDHEEESKQVTIITSFYPLADIAQKIAGKNSTVMNLAGGQEVHEYMPSPVDMAKLQNADLVIYMGGDLEPWAGEVVPQLAQRGVATAAIADSIPFYVNEGDMHKNEDAGTSHAHDQFDPHIWLDPVIAQEMARVIVSAISSVDPANAYIYSQNAQNVIEEFDTIDQLYRTGLAECARRDAIISHEAFGYIARRYDVDLHPIVGISMTDEPSAKILAELQSKAEEGATHVLAEKNSVQRFAQTIAQDAGLAILEINSLENGTGDPQKSYGDVMRDNLAVLRIALSCK